MSVPTVFFLPPAVGGKPVLAHNAACVLRLTVGHELISATGYLSTVPAFLDVTN